MRVASMRQSIYPVFMYVVVHHDIAAAHRDVFGDELKIEKCGGLMVVSGPRFTSSSSPTRTRTRSPTRRFT